jgi:hypothetical protein
MTAREPRLQSPALQAASDDLDDLRGQMLADAAFERKVAGLKRRAQRDILASFGQAMEAFAGRWEELDARHRREWEMFVRREAHLAGRVMNAARAMPLTRLAEAWEHMRTGLGSAEMRERGLAGAQARERTKLAFQQSLYRQALSKPHQDVLDMISVKTGGVDPEPARGDVRKLETLELRAQRLRLAQQMARSMERPVITAPRAPAQPVQARAKGPEREMD